MKKALIISIVAVLTATAVSGKVIRRQLNIVKNAVPETETIADETMEFVYDYRSCIDTTGSLKDNISSDNMLL